MDLLLHNLRTFGTHHSDPTVGEEAAQEIERLRGEIERMQSAATLARIAELEADAARYRWLRRKVCIIAKPGFMSGDSYAAFEFLNFPLPTHVAPCADIELDAAIDAAREAKP